MNNTIFSLLIHFHAVHRRSVTSKEQKRWMAGPCDENVRGKSGLSFDQTRMLCFNGRAHTISIAILSNTILKLKSVIFWWCDKEYK